MGALDRRLYTSHQAPTDTVSRLGPDRVKLARNGCMLPSAVRLSLSRYCTPPGSIPACLTIPKVKQVRCGRLSQNRAVVSHASSGQLENAGARVWWAGNSPRCHRCSCSSRQGNCPSRARLFVTREKFGNYSKGSSLALVLYFLV